MYQISQNSRVGDLIEQRIPIETADGRIVFSCPTLSEFFRTSNFELDLKTGQIFYIPQSHPKNIGNRMPEGPLRPRFPLQHATGRTGHQHGTRREFGKNPKHQKTSRTSGHNELRRNRTNNPQVLSLVATVCRHFSRTEEKVRTITGQRSSSMQSIRTLHV